AVEERRNPQPSTSQPSQVQTTNPSDQGRPRLSTQKAKKDRR
ncbi:hypothetical protein CDAR_117621, partial [Caerostris darwini]